MTVELIIRSTIYAFIFVSGIVGNLFVMFFFGFEMKRVPNFRWFVIHLAIADCTYAAISPFQVLYLIFSDGTWHLGSAFCKLSYIGPTTVNVSAFILCFMAYERYRAICHPFRERLSKRFINIIVACIWVICILLKVPVMNRLRVVDGECVLIASGNVEHLFIALSFLLFESILPLTLLLVFFIRITYALKKHEFFRDHSDSHMVVERTRSNTTKTVETTSSTPPRITFTDYDDQQDSSTTFGTSTNQQNEGGQFCLHRGMVYSGNHDVVQNHVCKQIADTESSISSSQSSSNHLQLDHLHVKKNIRRSYLHLKGFVKHHASFGSGMDIHIPNVKLFGIKDKRDRATISALFLSVALFALTSVPYNVFYFIITCLYLFYPENEAMDIEHGQNLLITNEWLGVIMLSGCIMNMIIYSGKFPQFRQQAFIWVTQFKRKVSHTRVKSKDSYYNNSSYLSTNYSGREHERSENNYIKV